MKVSDEEVFCLNFYQLSFVGFSFVLVGFSWAFYGVLVGFGIWDLDFGVGLLNWEFFMIYRLSYSQ